MLKRVTGTVIGMLMGALVSEVLARLPAALLDPDHDPLDPPSAAAVVTTGAALVPALQGGRP